MIVSVNEQNVTSGARFGKAALKHVFTRPMTKGRYLATLDADRGGESDEG